MKYWVYVHTCPNGKKYVGCTTQENPENRWCKGKGYVKNEHFYRAILKYGWDNITHETLEVPSKEEMYKKEAALISFYSSNDPDKGYNNTEGGENHAAPWNKGKKGVQTCSEETRKKKSLASKGKPKSPEHAKHISEGKMGHEVSDETKRKISETKKGKSYPRVRHKFLFPDGTIRELVPNYVKRMFTKKGVNVIRLD